MSTEVNVRLPGRRVYIVNSATCRPEPECDGQVCREQYLPPSMPFMSPARKAFSYHRQSSERTTGTLNTSYVDNDWYLAHPEWGNGRKD